MKCKWKVTIVLLAIAAVSDLWAGDKGLPEIWRRIDRTAESLRAECEGMNDEDRIARWDRAAQEIAKQAKRSEIETMVRSRDEYLEGDFEGAVAYRRDIGRELSLRVLAPIADPAGAYIIPQGKGGVNSCDWQWVGVAVAAIDSFHDARARRAPRVGSERTLCWLEGGQAIRR